jgi:hypothetical protein
MRSRALHEQAFARYVNDTQRLLDVDGERITKEVAFYTAKHNAVAHKCLIGTKPKPKVFCTLSTN